MKKFPNLLFAFLIVSTAWAGNSDCLTSMTGQMAYDGQNTGLFWAEEQINELKAAGSDVPGHLYQLVRDYYGLPSKSESASREGGDTVDDATVIDALPYNDTGSTSEANDDYDEVCPYEGSTSPDVVYSFTPAEDITIDITLCNGSEYDTKLYIYENEVTPGAPFACNDDECPGYVSELLELSFIGGNTYFIVIDGYGGESGNYVIDVTAPGGGDSCEDPYVAELPYQYIGTTVDNTDTYGNGGPDEWHFFTIEEAGLVIVDLCNETTDYDTYIHLLSDDCSTVVASNDDGPECPSSPAPYPPSYLEVELEAGSYVLGVEGYDTEAGNYQVDIYEYEPPLYGTCQYPPHTPDEEWSAGTSHSDGDLVEYLRADRFGEAGGGAITSVLVSGLSLVQDGGWMECVEDPMSFAVTFYEDGDLPGAVVASHQIEASPVATGDLYADFPLNEYTLDLPTPLELAYGWVSVQTSGDCWFLWMSTPDVDGLSAISEAGGDWGNYDFDLTWCLTISEGVSDSVTPNTVTLFANHPNPFNPETTISYDLDAPQQVELVVFNVIGEKVATLVNSTQAAGMHTQLFDGSDLPSGIYFVRLSAGDFSQTRRMLLVK